jgi:HJR/Mrr/RecB family endonuclease
MGRRRNRGPDIEGLVRAIVGLVLLAVLGIAFLGSGGNVHLFTQLLGGLTSLLWLGFIVLITGGVIFLIVVMVRATLTNRSHPPATGPTSGTIPRKSSPVSQVLVPPEPITFSRSMPPEPANAVEKLRATDWYQFEKVVGLIYESQGYRLSRRGGAKPDGGIDLIIEKDGDRAAVQCKRWKKWKVDLPKVRELFGAMTHEGLSRGVIVALNGFTLEAKQLAVEHNIDIVHDENLSVMIAGLAMKDQLKVQTMLDDATKHCPKCEATMVWRTPKPGKNWTPFWGCSRYPQCHGRLQEE